MKGPQLCPLTENDFKSLLPFSQKRAFIMGIFASASSWRAAFESLCGKGSSGSERVKKPTLFLVFDKQPEEVAGSTRFYDINFHHKSISIGFTWYGKVFQRTGLNRQCKLLLLSHAFEVLSMERVEFRADARNQKSINAMLGLGCVLEGTLRSNCNAKKERRDSVVLSILKAEWENGGKETLMAKTH